MCSHVYQQQAVAVSRHCRVTVYYGQRQIQERSEDGVSIRTAHTDSFSVVRTLLSTGSESGMDQIFV